MASRRFYLRQTDLIGLHSLLSSEGYSGKVDSVAEEGTYSCSGSSLVPQAKPPLQKCQRELSVLQLSLQVQPAGAVLS